MKKFPTPIPYKTIFQARYKAELKFYNLYISAAQQFPEYADWVTDRFKITLKDYNNHCSLTIAHNSFGYEQDSTDVDLEIKNISRTIERLPTALDVGSFLRLGYRQLYLISVDMPFESLVSIMNIKFFSQNNKLRQIIPSTVEDLMFRFNTSEEQYKHHISLGPIRKAEIPQWINFNADNHLNALTAEEDYRIIEQKYPETAVFIDIDFFQLSQQIPGSELLPFLDIARQKVREIATGLSEYLFSLEVEDRK